MHAPAIKRPVRVKTAICRGERERALQPEQVAGVEGEAYVRGSAPPSFK